MRLHIYISIFSSLHFDASQIFGIVILRYPSGGHHWSSCCDHLPRIDTWNHCHRDWTNGLRTCQAGCLEQVGSRWEAWKCSALKLCQHEDKFAFKWLVLRVNFLDLWHQSFFRGRIGRPSAHFTATWEGIHSLMDVKRAFLSEKT